MGRFVGVRVPPSVPFQNSQGFWPSAEVSFFMKTARVADLWLAGFLERYYAPDREGNQMDLINRCVVLMRLRASILLGIRILERVPPRRNQGGNDNRCRLSDCVLLFVGPSQVSYRRGSSEFTRPSSLHPLSSHIPPPYFVRPFSRKKQSYFYIANPIKNAEILKSTKSCSPGQDRLIRHL